MQTIQATVSSRSSRRPGGPPGEAELLELNPERRQRIIAVTEWAILFPGSLNLEVAEDSVHRLLLCSPVIREDAQYVRYPAPFAHVPKLRVGYLYYSARLRKGEKVARVLIRRAMNPLPKRIEAFSDQSLRAALELSDGDTVTCEIDEIAA